jgi:hypothetical protein
MRIVEILIHSPAIGDSITLRHVSDEDGSVLALFKGARLLVMRDPYPWHNSLAMPGVIESMALQYVETDVCASACGNAYYVATKVELDQRSEQP